MKLALECSLEQYDGLWAAVHGARASAGSVRVDRDALYRVLRDHGRVLAAAEPHVAIVNSYPPARLAKAAAQ